LGIAQYSGPSGLSKNANIFGENIHKIVTSVPGHPAHQSDFFSGQL
jgi:hypothetical protein